MLTKRNTSVYEKPALYLIKVLVFLWIFFLPTNLFLVLDPQAGYVHGLRVDYLLPRIWASQIFGVLALILYFSTTTKTKINGWRTFSTETKLFILGSSIFVVCQLLVGTPQITIWPLANVVFALAMGKWLVTTYLTEKSHRQWWHASLLVSSTFQAVIGLTQFWLQKSVGGYWLAGESNLLSYAGVDHGSVWEKLVIFPYGTTAHPNILAGFLVFVVWQLFHGNWELPFSLGKKTKTTLIVSWCLVILSCLILTQSLAAWMSLGMLLSWAAWKKWQPRWESIVSWIGLLGIVITPVCLSIAGQYTQLPSISRRVALNSSAVAHFLTQPITGVGLNHFVIKLDSDYISSEVVRFWQPVHHAPLLWVTETGLVGLVWVWLLLVRQKNWRWRDSAIWLFWPILASDHYLVSLVPGLWMLGILLAQQRRV
jgi:hypothetical protein